MLTENLNELIQQNPKEAFEFIDIDQDDMKNDSDFIVDPANSMPDLPVATNTNSPESSLPVPLIQIPEIINSNYQPDSEEALIDYTRLLHRRSEVNSIITYWEIGRCINSFYQGKYGSNELDKISKETGIGRDNLNKILKFAKQYNQKQLKTLIKGNFNLSWNGIVQNLTIEPEKLIEVYEASSNISEFHKAIMKCKNPTEKRGKSKLPGSHEEKETAAEKQIQVTSETIPDEPVPAEYNKPADDIGPDEPAQHYEAYEKELDTLKLKNKRLEEELLSRDKKIKEFEQNLANANKERERYEDLYYVYMDKLDKVRKQLENNTPARAILEWIEQGE